MVQKSKQCFSLILVILVAGVVITAKFWLDSRGASLTLNPAHTRAKGNPHAAIKIEEYIDFQCPACAEGAKLLRIYLEQHPKDLYVQLRFFPLYNMHRHAMMSTRYAQCASVQGRFWPFHDLLIDQQQQWEKLADARPVFDSMAQSVGIDIAKLQKCIEEEKTEDVIVKEQAEGRKKGVKSTPTYFVDSQMIVGKDALKKFLDERFSQK
ncbi:MAG: DsbA family protein [Candidatus Omnitrophica bacterium]|nr:DsbA family protein [Candidatus Omnitrophota bacterium]